jgi:hypothetical protein
MLVTVEPGWFALKAGIMNAAVDYSALMLMNADGNFSPLAYGLVNETSADAAISYYTGFGMEIGVNGATNLTESHYQSQSVGFVLRQKLFENMTSIGVMAGFGKQWYPMSFYRDDSLQIKMAPLHSYPQYVSAEWEQVVSSDFKFNLTAMTQQKRGERPRNVGGELKTKYALNDELSVGLDVVAFQELTGEPLLTDRGYFAAQSVTGKLGWNPWFLLDMLVEVSYRFGLEHETDPRRGYYLKSGLDEFGLAIKVNDSWGGAYLKGNYLSSSISTQWGCTLGISWKL